MIGSSNTALLNSHNTNFEFTIRGDNALFGTGNAGLRLRSHDVTTRTTISPDAAENTFGATDFATSTWHTYSVGITRTVAGFDFEASLINNTSSTSLFAASGSVVNASLASAANLYAGFTTFVTSAGSGSNSTFIAADNFSVIPEPSSGAALLGLVALGGVATRRRRSA